MARYIDADKLREEWLENGENEYVYDTNSVLDSIDAQPTADVVEVKHGEWLPTKDDGKKRCSKCDVIHLIAQYPNGQANYCPNCGADMRGEKMTCRDCIHYDICVFHIKGDENKKCCHFKNKADFVEVVRCKDCKHCYINKFGEKSNVGVCNNRGIIGTTVQLDDFCSYGIPKERSEGNG